METRASSLKMHEKSWAAENRDGESARESVSVSERVKEWVAVEYSLRTVACLCGGRWGASTCWMNPISAGEYHGLRVGSAVLSIVAGCIIIGVSRECDADAVGGIFLGAGGLGECVKLDFVHFCNIKLNDWLCWLLFASNHLIPFCKLNLMNDFLVW